jgi:hypothetical protein
MVGHPKIHLPVAQLNKTKLQKPMDDKTRVNDMMKNFEPKICMMMAMKRLN